MKTFSKISISIFIALFSSFSLAFWDDISSSRLVNRGLFFEQRGDLDKAEKYFSQALDKDPLNNSAFDGLKRVSLQKEELINNNEIKNDEEENVLSGSQESEVEAEKKNILTLFMDNYKLFILPWIAVLIWWVFLVYLNKKLPSNKKESSEIDDIF